MTPYEPPAVVRDCLCGLRYLRYVVPAHTLQQGEVCCRSCGLELESWRGRYRLIVEPEDFRETRH